MNKLSCLIGLAAIVGTTSALARDYVLLDTDKPAQNWKIDSQQLGIKTDKPFSVSLRTLHGGLQEGVSLIDIDTGAMTITVVPTRGMNVLRAVAGDVRMGWDSPVKDVVNPAFIEQNGRGGLGWLEGFNELVTRCGYEWVGHPGMDNGELLTLHGRAANIPATRVVLSIDEQPPYAIRLRGELKEQAFKKVDFSVATELSTTPGATGFVINDTLTNNGDYPKEYQALYHNNFGTPLLEQGARFVAPVKQVSPFNAKARGDLADWQTYRGPTKDYDETVYNLMPYGDDKGDTLAVLHNRAGDRGVRVDYNVQQLPVFSLWKNTDTAGQGYVTGLEPGTSFSYNRRFQRPLGLVPTIGPKEQRQFRVGFALLADKAAVDQAVQRVDEIQAGRPTEVREAPLVDLTKEP
ncbi:aldose 1-epimerase family protein [Azotobacter salinestris]|uniref:aldose 1-epimerase family protein n=1 Tax=Azotobacter salinestris TaxID=69964 RepID=UPI0032DE8724